MRSRTRPKLLLGLTAATMLAACSIVEEDTYYPMRSGRWEFVYREVRENTCFPLGIPVPPAFHSRANVENVDGSLRIGWGWLPLPPAPLPEKMDGIVERGDFSATGLHPVVVSSSCTLVVRDRVHGTIFTTDRAVATLRLGFDAATIASDGAPARCAALFGETFDGIPVPTLSTATGGSCVVTVTGELSRIVQ